MDKKLQQCLKGEEFDYLMPFLWLKGDCREALYQEILAIKQSGCNSFCAESRPYPDFCGEKWWDDFGFILKTARELNMHVWLLDDKHFPTGYANGAIEKKHPHLRKKMLRCEMVDVLGPQREVALLCDEYTKSGDTILSVVAYRRTGEGVDCYDEVIDLTDTIDDGLIHFDIPEGMWRVFFLLKTQKPTAWAPNHIDMLNPDSTELMISEVYKPQYEHFAEYFGNTFRGFFSDEPGFLNTSGHCCKLGDDMPLPWRDDIPDLMAEKLCVSRSEVIAKLPALWNKIGDITDFRATYMDIVSSLYAKNFTEKLRDWCHAHNVEHIGHIIEDSGAGSRLGYGSGHFFRALDAQDMSGVDVVLHQIIPGQTEMKHSALVGTGRLADPTFYTYALAKLGASHSHLNPNMKNRAMCEIFGAFGFAEGLPFMKKLADHMLACGISRFVPHAFSPKYPDSDCPPHFYCGGAYPQYEQFGMLMKYIQRVIHLFEGGVHKAPVALYYNAECEWAGDETDTYFAVAKELTQNQIDFDFVSEDYLCNAKTVDGKICINEEQYQLLVLPGCKYITPRMRALLQKLEQENVPFYFRGIAPVGFESHLKAIIPYEIYLSTPAPQLRYYHVTRNSLEIFMFKNDGEASIDTGINGLPGGEFAVYDAWNNKLYRKDDPRLVLASGESIIWIFGEDTQSLAKYRHPSTLSGEEMNILWNITAGENTYSSTPLFNLTAKGGLTRYSGKIHYTAECELPADTKMLDLGIVGEVAQLTLNGVDCGTCVAPPYAFDISNAVRAGKNLVEIEVVNNPAYRERDRFSVFMKLTPSGILGPVKVLK